MPFGKCHEAIVGEGKANLQAFLLLMSDCYPSSMELRHSVCALDCPDCCSLLINVENGRGTRLRGNPEHPVTRGFLCGKVAQYLEREYSPERLLYPQKRIGEKGAGKFERISWDEALETISRKTEERRTGIRV